MIIDDAILVNMAFDGRRDAIGHCEEHTARVEEQIAKRVDANEIYVREALRVLYDRGILSHPEDPAPANFCMVGWFDQSKLFAYEK